MPVITAGNTPPKQEATQTGFQPKKKDKEFPPIPEGVYNVEIARMTYRDKDTVTWTWPSWKKHDAEIAVGFKVVDGEYKNRWLWDEAPFDLSQGSKLRIWLQEITGFTDGLPEHFQFDTDELEDYVGLDCRIRVNQYNTKKGETKNGIQEVLAPIAETVLDDPF